MTLAFQVLDLTVNKSVKDIMMDKFNRWFTETLIKELDARKFLDEISIKFKLATRKPLHVKWVINVFNQLSSFEGKKVILAGWKASGISDEVWLSFLTVLLTRITRSIHLIKEKCISTL